MSELATYVAQCKEAMSKLPPGPWDNEPHLFRFKYLGFHCVMIRNPILMHYCGYIGIPNTHPWYRKSQDSIEIDVHGGLTFNGDHLPMGLGLESDSYMWWLGFDCAHAWDQAPFFLSKEYTDIIGRSSVMADGEYRTFAFVKKQLNRMASQARKAVRNRSWGTKRA